MLSKEQVSNEEEIRLLEQFVSSASNPDGKLWFSTLGFIFDFSAILEKLKDAIQCNTELGQQLGVENMQGLYEQKALLKRENQLLKATEEGIPFQQIDWLV